MERKDRYTLMERQVNEILDRVDPVNRLAQLSYTLARYFSAPGTKDRMLTHAVILAMVAGTIILTSP